MKVTYLTDGIAETLDAESGDSVMLTATQNGLEGIVGECGGSLSCASCHVYVDEAWFDKVGGPETEEERELLEGTMSPAGPTSRLSCQIQLTHALDGLVVRCPEEQI